MAVLPLSGARLVARRFKASVSCSAAAKRLAALIARVVLPLLFFGGALHGLTFSIRRLLVATFFAKPRKAMERLVPMGLDTESRSTFVIHSPSALSTVTEWLFARCVAWASCANLCFTRASALFTRAVVSSLGAAIAAPVLAKASTNRFARQSTMVSLDVPCAVALPTAAIDRCAGIHCQRPRSTISETSPTRVATMEFQMRASGLLCAVIALLPARADVRMERQSVLILGG